MSSVSGPVTQGVTSYKMGGEEYDRIHREMKYVVAQMRQRKRDIEEEKEKLISTQKVAFGASGVTSEGSPMEVMIDTEKQAAEEKRRIQKWTTLQYMEMQKQASLAKEAGRKALYSGITTSGFALAETVATYGASAMGGGSGGAGKSGMEGVSWYQSPSLLGGMAIKTPYSGVVYR